MLARIILKRKGKLDGESPFWISFSDLMSALMTLFLVVMAVTLVAVTKNVTAEEEAKILREGAIRNVMAKIKKSSADKKVEVNESTYQIDLGEIVRFESGQYAIQQDAAKFLRDYIPVLLSAKESPEGEKWMRRVVVEGFTDQDGTYLYNLGLSLDRSRSVVCALFAKPSPNETPLSNSQLDQIKNLFLVGGYSFNSVRTDKAASRRVELKIDFWGLGDKKPESNLNINSKEYGSC